MSYQATLDLLSEVGKRRLKSALQDSHATYYSTVDFGSWTTVDLVRVDALWLPGRVLTVKDTWGIPFKAVAVAKTRKGSMGLQVKTKGVLEGVLVGWVQLQGGGTC